MKKLWLLPILFLISGSALASQPYEIYAYWNIDELYTVFNGIASIIGSADFLGLLKTVMFIGAIVAMFSFLGTKQFDGWNWILGAMFVYTLMFLPIGTVILYDRTGTQPPKTVDNIPVMLAATASLTSHTGDWLTRGFEAVFSALPDDLKFQQHDFGFGHRILKESRRMTIADPELKSDIIQFIKNCTIYDIAQGRVAYQDIYDGFDPWNTLFLNTSTAHMTMYRTLSAAKTGYCSEVAVGGTNVLVEDSLKYRLDASINAAQQYYGRILNPDVTDNNIAGALLASQMPNAFQTMLGMSQNASDLIKQNMFINLWQEAGSAIPAMLGDTASVQLALGSAQAAASANASYKITARLAEDTMPNIRNIVELMIYAVFPIIVVFAVVAGNNSGPIFKSYIMSMAWVQLWPPLYAVANFVTTMYAAKKLQAVTMAAHGLAIQTAGAMDEMLISQQSMMGYVVTTIPFIALALVKGGEMAITSLTSKVGAPVDQAAATAGSKVGLGDVTQGQMSMDTARANMQSWNQYEKPGSLTQKSTVGTEQFDMATGAYRNTSNLGKSPILAASSHQISQQHTQSATRMESVAETESKAAERAMSATLNQVLSAAHSTSVQDQSGQGLSAGKTGSHSTQAQVVNEVTDRLGKELGISDTKKLELSVAASLTAGVGGKLGPVAFGAELQTMAKGVSSHDISNAIKHANDTLAKHGITNADQVVKDYRNSDEFKHLKTSNQEAADRIDSGFQKAQSFRESSAVNYQKAKEQREMAQRAETLSTTMTGDDTVAINNIRAKMGLAQESDPNKLAPVVEEYLQAYNPYGPFRPTPLAAQAPVFDHIGAYRKEFEAAHADQGAEGILAAVRKHNEAIHGRMGGLDPNATVRDGGLGNRVENGQQAAERSVANENGVVTDERKTMKGRFKSAQAKRPGAR